MGKNTHKHLRRLDRVWINDPMYYITTCSHHRRPILARQAVMDILIGEWGEALDRHGWAVGPFTIMPDHVHFFCKPAVHEQTLSAFMEKWKEWTSKRTAAALDVRPPIWQEEFFDHVLRSDESYSDKREYVSENPVRAGLVAKPRDWPFRGHIHFE